MKEDERKLRVCRMCGIVAPKQMFWTGNGWNDHWFTCGHEWVATCPECQKKSDDCPKCSVCGTDCEYT